MVRASPSARSTVGLQPSSLWAADGSHTQSAVSQSLPGWAPAAVAIGLAIAAAVAFGAFGVRGGVR